MRNTGPLIWIIFGVLVAGSVWLTFKLMARASTGYEKVRARREAEPPRRPCSTCRGAMHLSGLREIDSGGEAVVYEEYVCPICRKVEFFLPPAALEDPPG